MLKWLAIFGLLWFLYLVREVFPPFIVGGIIAYLLLPLVRFVGDTIKMPRHVTVGAIYIGFLFTIIILSKLFGGLLIEQAGTLFEDRHEIIVNLLDQLSGSFGWQMDVKTTSADIVTNLEGWLGKPEELMHLGELISKSLLHILVCIVSSIYLIMDSESVGRFLLRFIPEDRRDAVVQLSGQMNVMVSKYIRTQLFLIILMSTVAYCILHFAFQIKYAFLIAILSGTLEIIPVVGPLLAISIAVIVGVAQKGVQVGGLIALCYWIARLLEDYVVIPKFVGHVIELHPLAIIFAVICGEVLAGALGMLIAIPVAAAVKLVLDFAYPPADAHGPVVHVDSTMFKPPKPKDPDDIIEEMKAAHE
ncbi:MAG: AI-2E family transporter [Candidatus Melainabacteria bacterium]|nr:AI-2E family transporter [Candidatus Melainabacteria bacterium]